MHVGVGAKGVICVFTWHQYGAVLSWYCNVFGINFNIMSGLFIHQSPTLPQKTILAKVCFDAKRGYHVDAAK